LKPVEYYTSNQILAEEQQLFNQCRYITHKTRVPELEDYWCVTQCATEQKEARILINTEQGPRLLSNVCRHRQARMLSGQGNTPSIVCPIHAWTYDLQGQNVACPKWNTVQQRHLTEYKLKEWSGFLFETDQADLVSNLDKASYKSYFNFENYAFHSELERICNFNWKTFMEVQAENLHIDFVHKGLSNWVDSADMQYEWHKEYYVNSVAAKRNLSTAGSAAFEPWQERLQPYMHHSDLDHGAIWLTIYPNIMIEIYPQSLLVMTVWPETAQRTRLITEYYYPKDICWFDPELVQAHQQADLEVLLEDIMICERMDQGRLQLFRQGQNDIGPVHPKHEVALDHFYQWYDRSMAEAPLHTIKDEL
jgi:choline monooxygenase